MNNSTNKNLNSRFWSEFQNFADIRKKFWNSEYDKGSSRIGNYYKRAVKDIVQNSIPKGSTVLELGCGSGELLNALSPNIGVGIDFSAVAISRARSSHKHLRFYEIDVHELSQIETKLFSFDFIILSDLVNELWDVQLVFSSIQRYCGPNTRILINYHSNLWNMPLTFLRKIGFLRPRLIQNWLTPEDMENLLSISGFEVIRKQQEILIPVYIPYASNLINRYLGRIWPFRLLNITNFLVARPSISLTVKPPPLFLA